MSSEDLQNSDLRVGRLDVLVPSVQGFLAVPWRLNSKFPSRSCSFQDLKMCKNRIELGFVAFVGLFFFFSPSIIISP